MKSSGGKEIVIGLGWMFATWGTVESWGGGDGGGIGDGGSGCGDVRDVLNC